MSPNEKSIIQWDRMSKKGTLCGVYGCHNKPPENLCHACKKHYCEKHFKVHGTFCHENKKSDKK